MTAITVHHLNQSRSQRILWLLEELGLPYDIVRYQRDPKTLLAPPELKRIHPLGKSPVVVVDGEVLAESGAIIETLVERFGAARLAPAPGTPEFTRYRYWLHYAGLCCKDWRQSEVGCRSAPIRRLLRNGG